MGRGAGQGKEEVANTMSPEFSSDVCLLVNELGCGLSHSEYALRRSMHSHIMTISNRHTDT